MIDNRTYTFAELEETYRGFFAPAFEISVEGQKLNLLQAAVSGVRVDTTTETRADHCQFRIENAYNAVSREFRWVGSLIEVGKSLEVKMGYTDKLVTLFDGIITGITLDYPEQSQPTVSVTGMDRSMLMMRSVQSKEWHDVKVSDVVKEIGGKYGLQLQVKETTETHKTIEQFRKSDFHFLKKLAEDEFFEFFVVGQTLYFRESAANSDPVLTLMYGKNLSSYTAEVDITKQVSQVVVHGVNRKTNAKFSGASRPMRIIGTNGRAGPDVMNALSRHLIENVYRNVATPMAAQKLADSLMSERGMDLVTGQGQCIGLPELRAGRFVKLEGLGPKFNQPMLLASVTHAIDSGGYTTSFTVKGNAI